MKKISRRTILLFVIAFLVTLLVTAPASILGAVVESASKGKFVLANAAGTVWQGSATPAIHQRSGDLLALEKLHWDIAFWPLFTGKMITRLQWDNVQQSKPMLVTVSFKQIELRNVVLPVQAAVLGELTPMLQPVQLSGRMQLNSELLTLTKQGVNGVAVVEWLNAGSVMSAVNPLGSYRINLTGAGEKLDVTLITTSGALLLDGKGTFTLNQGLNFQVTARASADSKGSLDELLNNFGPESSPGVHTLSLMR